MDCTTRRSVEQSCEFTPVLLNTFTYVHLSALNRSLCKFHRMSVILTCYYYYYYYICLSFSQTTFLKVSRRSFGIAGNFFKGMTPLLSPSQQTQSSESLLSKHNRNCWTLNGKWDGNKNNCRFVLCPSDGRKRRRCVRPVSVSGRSRWRERRPAARRRTHRWPVSATTHWLIPTTGCLERQSRGRAASSWTASTSTPLRSQRPHNTQREMILYTGADFSFEVPRQRCKRTVRADRQKKNHILCV